MDDAWERNFELDPATTTNSVFGHKSGQVQGNGKLNTIPAGTVSYSGDSFIYIDWNRISPKIKSIGVLDTLPAHSILLYQINNGVATDYRSWSSASSLSTGEDSSDLSSSPADDVEVTSEGGVAKVDDQITDILAVGTPNPGLAKWALFIIAFNDDTSFVSDFRANGGTPEAQDSFPASTHRIAVHSAQGYRVEVWAVRNFELRFKIPEASSGGISFICVLNQASDYGIQIMTGVGIDEDPGINTNEVVVASFSSGTSSSDESFPVFGTLEGFNGGGCYIYWNGAANTMNASSQRSPWINWAPRSDGTATIRTALTYIEGTTSDGDADQTFNITPDVKWISASVQVKWGQQP